MSRLHFGQTHTFEWEDHSLLTKVRFKPKKKTNDINQIANDPFLIAYSVLILISGAFPTAFCTTRNNFVTISITWPVWKTKSPFFLLRSLWNKQPVGCGVSWPLLHSDIVFATGHCKPQIYMFYRSTCYLKIHCPKNVFQLLRVRYWIGNSIKSGRWSSEKDSI